MKSMKVRLMAERNMEWEYIGGKKAETFGTVHGKTANGMVMVSCSIKVEKCRKENGKMICL